MAMTFTVAVKRQDNPAAGSRWEKFSILHEPGLNVTTVLQRIAARPVTVDHDVLKRELSVVGMFEVSHRVQGVTVHTEDEVPRLERITARRPPGYPAEHNSPWLAAQPQISGERGVLTELPIRSKRSETGVAGGASSFAIG